MINHISDFGQS